MLTFQDLLETSEGDRGKFCRDAVNNFRASAEYSLAKDGMAYYDKHNVTIEKYQKMLMTMSGEQKKDIFSANYKLKSLIFRRLVTQEVQYVLANGLTLQKPENKKKLGKSFDHQLAIAAAWAMAGSRSFGFWNYDHLEVFGYADTPSTPGFCPLYDAETGQIGAGIRYWFRTIGDENIFRATLYEKDGFTEYRQVDDKKPTILQPKRGYKRTTMSAPALGVVEVRDENYSDFPIVPLYANDTHESELVGIRENVDAYDFIKSGFANDIDASGFYWILENTGGMDDTDLAEFVQRMKTVKAAAVDGNQGVKAEAHTIDIPVEARRTMLELIRKDIYEDFQALDVSTLSAAAKTTQEIQAAYQSQDNKCSELEYHILDFVDKILELAGIDDEPTFKWNKIVNQAEQTNMILSAANYLPEEIIINHLPFLTPEEADIAIKAIDKESFDRFNDEEDDEEGGEE